MAGSILLNPRQAHEEGGAGRVGAYEVDTSIVQLDDAIGNGETDAGAVRLGAEVELEDAGAALGGDADAAVGDGDEPVGAVGGDADMEGAAIGHGFDAVAEEIEEGLFE